MAESGKPSPCPKCNSISDRVMSRCHIKMGWVGLAEVDGKLHRVDLTPIADKKVQYEHRRRMEMNEGASANVVTTEGEW
jgi:hypothetical protein